MTTDADRPRSTLAAFLFDLLDPVPFGCFVAALVFDATYAQNGEILWMKGAAWLIVIGLLAAVLPRLINLAFVWFPGRRRVGGGEKASFWMNLLAIVAAIVNAFVHSRDAYGVMPEGLLLSIVTVGLLVVGRLALTLQRSRVRVEA